MSQVDFVPATVSHFEERGTYVAVIFPMQPVVSGQEGLEPIPFHGCELHIWSGRAVASSALTFPLKIENLWIKHERGGNGCFLPEGFEVFGPVELSFEMQRGSEVVREVVLVGSRATLHLLSKVKECVPTYEP